MDVTMPLHEFEALRKDALNWRLAQYEGNTEKLAESIENKMATKYGKQCYHFKERLRSDIRELKFHFETESYFGFLRSNRVLEELNKLLYNIM